VSPRVAPAIPWPPYPSLEPRRVGGAATATGLAGHKGARPSRGGLTGEPLGASRRTGWGTRMMAEGVGRRNLSCTGKPRGLREISGRTRGGDQANRLTEAAPVGVPAARRCRGGRHLVYAGRKPGPVPWGLPPSGPASAPTGGRAWASGSPPTAGRRPPRKGSIGICGAWSPEGRARAKRVHGGGDSPPGSRRPSRPLPASREGRWPPKRHSHGRPGPGGLAVPVGLASRCRWLGVVVPAGRLGPRLAGEAKAHPPPRAVEPVPKGA